MNYEEYGYHYRGGDNSYAQVATRFEDLRYVPVRVGETIAANMMCLEGASHSINSAANTFASELGRKVQNTHCLLLRLNERFQKLHDLGYKVHEWSQETCKAALHLWDSAQEKADITKAQVFIPPVTQDNVFQHVNGQMHLPEGQGHLNTLTSADGFAVHVSGEKLVIGLVGGIEDVKRTVDHITDAFVAAFGLKPATGQKGNPRTVTDSRSVMLGEPTSAQIAIPAPSLAAKGLLLGSTSLLGLILAPSNVRKALEIAQAKQKLLAAGSKDGQEKPDRIPRRKDKSQRR